MTKLGIVLQGLVLGEKKSGTRCDIQGDPNQNLLLQKAITLKIYISDPILVKPKFVWRAQVYF